MARGDRQSLDTYLKRFKISEEEFFSLSEGEQRARLGLASTDKLIQPSAEVAKASAALKSKREQDAAAAKAKAAQPAPAAPKPA